MVMARDTTSREARSFAEGAYLSMNRSPSELRRIPPSPRQPDDDDDDDDDNDDNNENG